MLNNDDAVAAFEQGVESCQQALDVVEVESGGGLVENEEGVLLLFHSEEIGKLHALVLTSGKCRRALAQLDVTQSDVFERLKTFTNRLVAVLPKEFDGLADGHVEHVVDVLAFVSDVENVALEPLPVAGVAHQFQIGHELHFHGNDTCALAFLASSSVSIEGEELRTESHLLGEGLFGKQLANGVVGLHVGCRVRARALANWILVDQFHVLHSFPIAFKRKIFARQVGHLVEMAFQGGVEDAFQQG